MKILATPISVLAHFENNGTPHPLRFTLNDKEIRIERVVSMTEEKIAGIECCYSDAKARSAGN